MKFQDESKQKILEAINKALVEKDSEKSLLASVLSIVNLANESEKAREEVFVFACKLYNV